MGGVLRIIMAACMCAKGGAARGVEGRGVVGGSMGLGGWLGVVFEYVGDVAGVWW